MLGAMSAPWPGKMEFWGHSIEDVITKAEDFVRTAKATCCAVQAEVGKSGQKTP
jgi:hypothetical protein